MVRNISHVKVTEWKPEINWDLWKKTVQGLRLGNELEMLAFNTSFGKNILFPYKINVGFGKNIIFAYSVNDHYPSPVETCTNLSCDLLFNRHLLLNSLL